MPIDKIIDGGKMNEVQEDILRKLMHKPGQSFNKLWNKEIESNKFAYHLKKLREENLIRKDDEEYFLTHEGKKHSSKVDGKSGKKTETPLSTVVVVLEKDGKVLMQQRKKEPFYDYWGFPSGKIEFDQYIMEAAKSELKEETGLEAEEFNLSGLLCSKTYNNGDLSYNHHLFVVKASEPKGELIERDREGKNEWVDKEEVKKLKSFPDVLNLLNIAMSEEFKVLQGDRYQKDDEFEDKGKLKDIVKK